MRRKVEPGVPLDHASLVTPKRRIERGDDRIALDLG
jgi:hypothetical protein